MIIERILPPRRLATISMIVAGLTLGSWIGDAQSRDASHLVRKADKARKPSATAIAPRTGSINTPSMDFSKIDRSDGDAASTNGPSFHPSMGAGGMGLGGAF